MNQTERRYYVAERTRNDYRTSNNRSGGYNTGSRPQQAQQRKPRLSHNILPPPGILEAYEDLEEGSVSRLFKQAREEQEHRHAWEDKYLREHVASYRFGQFLGFLVAVGTLAGSVILAREGLSNESMAVAGSGFGFLTITAFVSAKGRRFARRPARYQQQDGQNRDYRNNNERSYNSRRDEDADGEGDEE
jgi:uncharacterized membrane protein